MTDTFTSDSGVKYDIVDNRIYSDLVVLKKKAQVVETNVDKYITENKVLQKSSQSSEVQRESPALTISEKQDFGKSLITFMRNEGLFDGNIGSHQKIKNFLSSNGYL